VHLKAKKTSERLPREPQVRSRKSSRAALRGGSNRASAVRGSKAETEAQRYKKPPGSLFWQSHDIKAEPLKRTETLDRNTHKILTTYNTNTPKNRNVQRQSSRNAKTIPGESKIGIDFSKRFEEVDKARRQSILDMSDREEDELLNEVLSNKKGAKGARGSRFKSKVTRRNLQTLSKTDHKRNGDDILSARSKSGHSHEGGRRGQGAKQNVSSMRSVNGSTANRRYFN